MRHLLGWFTTLGVLFILTGSAKAQFAPYPNSYRPYPVYPGLTPSGHPPLSPYLNFLRGGNQAANFYMGVIPERERRTIANRYQFDIRQLELDRAPSPTREDPDDLLPQLPATGHGTTFMNPSPYFNNGYSPRQPPFPSTTTRSAPPMNRVGR